MNTLFTVLHVVGGVFIVGPMAILPMSAVRALRAGNAGQVATLAKSTALFSYLSLIVFVLGFAVVGMSDPQDNFTVATPWILASIILYAIAILVSLLVVVPAMKRAAAAGAAVGAVGTPAVIAPNPAEGSSSSSGYPAIGAGSGVVALLLVAVVVLMVWKP